VPYNELIVTVDLASDLHRLDEASTLVELLQWVVDCAQKRSTCSTLFIARGSALKPWRGANDAVGSRTGHGFPLNVGGRVVAVLFADPADAQARAAIDILTSYASRALESMTLQKALGLVPPHANKMGSGVI
jgi:hypothetical protein